MNGVLEWSASIGAIVAAALIAFDISRRVTGWGFVLFCLVAVLWIVSGAKDGAVPIIAQNAALLLINAWGVWRYLRDPAGTPSGDEDSHHEKNQAAKCDHTQA